MCLDISSKKKVPIEIFFTYYLKAHNKQQAGIKSICTEERGEMLRQLQICVQILVVSGIVPPTWSNY